MLIPRPVGRVTGYEGRDSQIEGVQRKKIHGKTPNPDDMERKGGGVLVDFPLPRLSCHDVRETFHQLTCLVDRTSRDITVEITGRGGGGTGTGIGWGLGFMMSRARRVKFGGDPEHKLCYSRVTMRQRSRPGWKFMRSCVGGKLCCGLIVRKDEPVR